MCVVMHSADNTRQGIMKSWIHTHQHSR